MYADALSPVNSYAAFAYFAMRIAEKRGWKQFLFGRLEGEKKSRWEEIQGIQAS